MPPTHLHRAKEAAPLNRFLLCELAELVDYPGPSFRHVLDESRRHASKLDAPARDDLSQFVEWAAAQPVEAAEEQYAATFDSNDECALELGWHLHGESYARGVMLVDLRKRLRDCGVEEGSELPDHLAPVLRWLVNTSDAADAERWTRLSIVPALTRIVAGLEKRSSPWAPLLRAIARVLDPSWTPADPTKLAPIVGVPTHEPVSFDDEQRDGFEPAESPDSPHETDPFASGCGGFEGGFEGGCR